MFKNSDGVVFHELIIPAPLWDFMEFCEIYCTAECCEDAAFEQHQALIRRKIINMDIINRDGEEQFFMALDQLKVIVEKIQKIKPESENDQISIRTEARPKLHEYQLNFDISSSWFNKWLDVFNEIKSTKYE